MSHTIAEIFGVASALGGIAAMHDGPPRAAPDTVDAEQTSAQGYDRFERR